MNVSVIIPAYNSELFIVDCLNSVLPQISSGDEIIIIDDGSIDSTESLIKHMQIDNPTVVLLSQENSGKPSIARNNGIRHSKNEIIMFLDSDDIFLHGKVSLIKELFESNPDVNFIYHDYYLKHNDIIDEQSKFVQLNYIDFIGDYVTKLTDSAYKTNANFFRFISLQDKMGIGTCAVSLRKTILDDEKELFSEDMVLGEDHDLWLRLLIKSNAIIIDKPLFVYTKHDSSITVQDASYMSQALIDVASKNLVRNSSYFSSNEVMILKRKIRDNYIIMGYEMMKIERMKSLIAFLNSILYGFDIRSVKGIIKLMLP